MPDLSKDESRRLALQGQGMYDPQPAGSPNRATLKRVLERVGVFQIDSVNVLARSHYLPLFSRRGPYATALLWDAAWGPPSKRLLFEYWAHEASLVPLALRPLFAWRMERARQGRGMWNRANAIAKKRRFVESLLREIETGGASAASSFQRSRGTGSWWGWSDVKVGLEYLFWAGLLTARTRTNGFERVYDLPERVFSPSTIAARVPERLEAQRELLLLALGCLGVGTQADLRDYFRLPSADANEALASLLEDGAIVRATVEGWKSAAYILPATRIPRGEPARAALLSPFDSLIWNRDRARRLFDFHYRIEIYTPSHKRVHGYYVLPILRAGRLIGRVDLKLDRAARALRVRGEHYEDGVALVSARATTGELLASMAQWLGAESIDRPAVTARD